MSEVSSWTTVTQNVIQAQIIFTHMLSNIVGYSYIKANEEEGIMAEEDLNINIILDSGYSIDLFRNTQLVTDIKRSNQVLHLSTNVGSKINQMQVMIPDYGKVWYDNKAIENIFSLTNLVQKYRVT